MERIDHFNLRNFNLNLMVAFDALYAERSVTRAAARMRVQQPAMSHLLGQLRLLFADQLFVRVGLVLEPTPRAQALAGPLRDLLVAAQNALLTRPGFDPLTEQRTFTLGLSDQLEALFLPAIVTRLQSVAPGIRLRTLTTSRDQVFQQLDKEIVDFALGSFGAGPAWCERRLLFTEHHVCCFHPDRLDLAPPLSLDAYLGIPHALVSRSESPLGYMADALQRAGVTPIVGVTTVNFMTLFHLVATAPMLCTVPSRMAEHFASSFSLATSPLPFAFEPFEAELLWHRRNASDACTAWLSDLIHDCCTRPAAENERQP